MPIDLSALHPSWLTVLAAVLPALLGAWWSRSMPSDPAVLAEWHHGIGQRLSTAAFVCTVVIFAVWGWSGWWLLAVELVTLASVRHRLRRALFGESWSFWSYLSWQVRVFVAALGFWIFIAIAPALVGEASPDTAWGWALGGMVLGVLWLHFHGAIVTGVLRARPLTRPDLDLPFRNVFERSTITRPSMWRAGERGGLLANALALPSARGHGVLFFDTLIEQLTPEETTAILAHEVAHLEYFDARLGRMHAASVGATIGVLSVAAWIATRDRDLTWLMTHLWPLLAFGALYLRASRMRAHETTSDLRAVELSGNAEALVSGLIRLHALNHVPRRLATSAEDTATHPSLARRIRDIRAHAGIVEPTLVDPTVVASSEPGRFVIFGATAVSFVWADVDPSASEETIRAHARRLESTGYAELADLRLTTSAAGVALTAVDRQARRSTFPLSPGDTARMQRVLDVVDQRLGGGSPAARSQVADRITAGLVLGLGVTLTSFAGAVPALLALMRPSRRILTALAAGLLGASAIGATRGPAGQVVAVVLLPLLLVAMWRARRGDTRPASPRWRRVEAAGIAVPVLAAGAVALASGGHLYDLHELLGEHPWMTSSLLALAGYLGTSPGQASRRLAAAAARSAGAALWCASPWFVAAVGADPLVVTGPALRERRVQARPIGHVLVDGRFRSTRLTPDGTHFLLTDAPDGHEDDAGRAPRDFLLGSLTGRLRTLRAVDAQLVDDTRLLVLEHSRGNSELRLEAIDEAETTWTVTVPDMLAGSVAVSRDGRWRLARDRPNGVSWVDGRLGGTTLERRAWTLEPGESGVPVAYHVSDAPVALALDVDWAPGPLRWTPGSAHARTSLLVGGAGPVEALARSHLLVECVDATAVASPAVVCTAYDGRQSHVWSLHPAERRLVPVGRWRGYLHGWALDGSDTLDVDANGLPARLDLGSRTLTLLDLGDTDCPVITGHALAGPIVATLCERASGTEVTLYDATD
jgi:Zn-dependent protease with chaperone function